MKNDFCWLDFTLGYDECNQKQMTKAVLTTNRYLPAFCKIQPLNNFKCSLSERNIVLESVEFEWLNTLWFY